MYQLEFARVYDYSGEAESIVIPVVLRSAANEIHVAASVDTGASFCVFRTEIAAPAPEAASPGWFTGAVRAEQTRIPIPFRWTG